MLLPPWTQPHPPAVRCRHASPWRIVLPSRGPCGLPRLRGQPLCGERAGGHAPPPSRPLALVEPDVPRPDDGEVALTGTIHDHEVDGERKAALDQLLGDGAALARSASMSSTRPYQVGPFRPTADTSNGKFAHSATSRGSQHLAVRPTASTVLSSAGRHVPRRPRRTSGGGGAMASGSARGGDSTLLWIDFEARGSPAGDPQARDDRPPA